MFYALDVKNKELLSSYLLTIPNQTVISVTHDVLEKALSFYDEVIKMEDGKVIFRGSPSDMIW